MHGTVIFSLSHTFFLWKMKTTICLMGSQHIILCSRLKWWTAKVLSCVDHPPLLEFFKGVFYVFMPVSCSVISTIAEQVYITLMSPLKVKTSNARGQYQIIKTNGTMPESCCLAFPLLNNNKKKKKTVWDFFSSSESEGHWKKTNFSFRESTVTTKKNS